MKVMTRSSSNPIPLLALCTVLASLAAARGGGTVSSLSQSELESALAGGGTVLFETNGTVVLSQTITISKDARLDANGYKVKISGAGAVRLFEVNTNVQFELRGLSLADGLVAGADGQDGDPAPSGQDGYGAGILNLGGTLRLTDCTLSNCIVQGGNAGTDQANGSGNTRSGGRGVGAALCNLGGQVYLTNCAFTANRATGGQGSPNRSINASSGNSGKALGGAL
jgi:hypothetical protein